MKNHRADAFRPAAASFAASLTSLPGEVTHVSSTEYGPGGRTHATLMVAGWIYTLQLSGLPGDMTGLSGPSRRALPTGSWETVAIVEEVEEYLRGRLLAALAEMPAVAAPTLPMTRGDSRDRAMGWASWPSGPDYVENRIVMAA